MELKCVLCGSKMGSFHDNWGYPGDAAYFDRGFSTNCFLCKKCREHKTNLLNFDIDEKVIIKSEEYMNKYMEGKVVEIRDIVKGWIDGESINYFPEMKDLTYYVEGPEAYLFVFKDRVVVLSSILDGLHGKTNINYDAVMLLPMGENDSGFVIFDDNKDNIGDTNKLNYKPESNKKYGSARVSGFMTAFASLGGLNYKSEEGIKYVYSMSKKENGMQLKKSLGDYGSLDFVYEDYEEKVFSFKFFYHQNQLMEEVYNYIQHRVAVAGKEGEELEKQKEPVQETSSRRRKAMENKSSENSGFSLADELNKLKGLVDCGVLTQEEFDEAKKKLLAKL